MAKPPPKSPPTTKSAQDNKATLDRLLAAQAARSGTARPRSSAKPELVILPGPRPTGKIQEESRRIKNLLSLVIVLAMATLSMFERPIFVLLLAALVPTMIAWLVDDSPRQQLLRTVSPLNLASAMPFVLQLWFGRNTMAQAMSLLTNAFVILALYGAAGFGWVLYYLAPAIINGILQRRIDRRRKTLLETQKTLVEDWGEEVATMQ